MSLATKNITTPIPPVAEEKAKSLYRGQQLCLETNRYCACLWYPGVEIPLTNNCFDTMEEAFAFEPWGDWVKTIVALTN